MMTRYIYLSLGSNLGDRVAHLHAAVNALSGALEVRRVSSLYATDPYGVTDQPEFVNLALEATTTLDPLPLLHRVKQVEQLVGRRPTFRWGPRVVDLDILLYGDLVLETSELSIPHPEMTGRAFVLVPLAEIAPQVRHPLTHRTIAQLAADVPNRSGVRLIDPFDQNPPATDHS